MTTINFEHYLDGLKRYVGDTGRFEELLAPFKVGDTWDKIGALPALILEGVQILEKIGADAGAIAIGTGPEKKKALVKFIDDGIELPWVLDKTLDVDGRLISAIIEGAIIWLKARGIFGLLK